MQKHLLLLAACIGLSGCPAEDTSQNSPQTTAVSDSFLLDVENRTDSGFILDVLSNDSFAATPEKLIINSQPAHGSVQLEDNGTADVKDDKLRYIPDENFAGDASFAYAISAADGSVSQTIVKLQLRGLSALHVDVGNKYGSVHLSWKARFEGNYAHHYRLLKSPDGVQEFTVIENAGNLSLNRYEFDLPLNALQFYGVQMHYRLELCDADGRILATRQTVLNPAENKDLVTYIKSDEGRFFFGRWISLSADGNTLALTANHSTGDGVYIYKRSNGRWGKQTFILTSGIRWGISLSADGNTLAIGVGESADIYAGVVYVYRNTNGSWINQGRLLASNRDEQDYLGRNISLSADGNTLAVSADGEDSNTTGVNGDAANNDAKDAGAVYVFAFDENDWRQQAYLKGTKTVKSGGFGESISLSADGNTLAVGAPRAPDGGSVYMFKRSEGEWSHHREVRGNNTHGSDHFGNSVSLSGDGRQLAVSAPYAITATEIPEFTYKVTATGYEFHFTPPQSVDYLMTFITGAAYVFEDQDDNWQQAAYIKPPVTGYSQFFHFPSFARVALSADGQNLLVGVAGDASSATGIEGDPLDNNAPYSGAALLFKKQEEDWAQAFYLKASNAGADDAFGTALAISADGGVIAIGALNETSASTGVNGDQSNNDVNIAGAVYLF